MYLHKYREIKDGDDTLFERLQTLLQTQAFWCARPDTLNDDLEFSWSCDYKHTDETLELLAKLMIEERNWSYEFAREQLKTLLSEGRLEQLAEQIVGSVIEQCRAEIGVLCFGTSPNNKTLWSRYGGNGKGVCIEISVPDKLIGTSLFCVNYTQTKVVHINTLLRAYFGESIEMYNLALLTKPKKWEPEEEIRFVSKSQNINVKIDNSLITRVYLGSKLTECSRDRVASIVKNLPYEVALCEQNCA